MAFNMIDFIAKQANKTGDTVAQLGRKGVSFSTLPTYYQDNLIIWNCRIKEFQEDIGATGSSFIIGHNVEGILGTNKLGEEFLDPVLLSVHNAHNRFIEGFWNDRFIQSGSSTGSWFETDEKYRMTTAQQLQTEYIALEDKVYKSVYIDIDSVYSDTGSDANSDLKVTALIGTASSFDITPGIDNNITNDSSDGLKIKIENDGAETGLAFPLTFSFEFVDAGQNIDITQFIVTYTT